MLTAALERELHDKILAFAAAALPDSESSDGQAVEALRAGVLRVATGALDEFAAARNARMAAAGSSVNRLPAELLLHVAAHLPFRALDAAARVCKRWHALLTADAALWSNINISFHYSPGVGGGNSWAEALKSALDRARGRCATLCLQAAAPALPYEVAPLVELAVDAFTGLRHLVVALDDLSPGAPWAGVFAAPAPALRTLQVHATPGAPTLRLPDALFAGHAPHLVSVMLVNALLPHSPGPALARVWDFGYYGMPFVGGADVLALCAALPALSDLTLVADQFDCGAPEWGGAVDGGVPAGWTPPALDRLCLRGFVPEGVVERLAAATAARTGSELRILQATGALRSMAAASPGRLSEIYAVAEPYRRHEASLVIKSSSGSARCIEYEPFFSVLDVLLAARHRLSDVRSLAISDALLSLVLHSGLHASFGALESLTVILGHEPSVPCRHLFVGPDDPLLSSTDCPALQTLRLSAYERYSLTYDPVVLRAELVRRWIPRGVKALVLRGVVFDGCVRDEEAQMPCEVRREWGFSREGHDEYLYWDVSWWQCYPATSSLYV